MPPRRQEQTEPLSDSAQADLADGLASAARGEIAPMGDFTQYTKPNPMREALAAQGKLDRINKRESDAITNARAPYAAERADVWLGLSDAVKRILEAAAQASDGEP